MKKLLVVLISICMIFAFSNPALATEQTATDESLVVVEETAGITPDSFLYELERLIERIQLSITQSEERLALLQAELALERAAEAALMIAGDNQELANQVTEEYKLSLEAAAAHLTAAIEAADQAVVVKDQVIEAIKSSSEIYNVNAQDVADLEGALSEVMQIQDEVVTSIAAFYIAKENFFAAKAELAEARKALNEARKSGDPAMIEELEARVQALEAKKDELEQIKDIAEDMKETLEGQFEVVEELLEIAEENIEEANDIMDDLEESIKEAEEEALEKAKEAEEAAREAQEEALEKAKEAKEEALEKAKEAEEEAREAAKEALEKAKEAQEEALDKAREARED